MMANLRHPVSNSWLRPWTGDDDNNDGDGDYNIDGNNGVDDDVILEMLLS